MRMKMPMVAQSLFNRPVFLSEAKAEMIVAVLAGRMDISLLETPSGVLDRAGMRDLAMRGRMEAVEDRERYMAARKVQIPEGPMMCEFYGDRPYRLSASGIAVIEICGTLTRCYGIDPESGFTGYDGIWTKLAFAMDDSACRAIWLKINSHGGSPDGLFDLTDAIWKCSARNGGKPIWAFAGDIALSAGYAFMACADKAFAPELGNVGSIGAVAVFLDYTAAMDEAGVKAVIFRSAPRKAIGIGGMESLDQEEMDHIQGQIDFAGNVFQDRVAAYRGLSKASVSKTRGTDYRADEAKAVGLIDGIMPEQDAWAKLERQLQ